MLHFDQRRMTGTRGNLLELVEPGVPPELGCQHRVGDYPECLVTLLLEQFRQDQMRLRNPQCRLVGGPRWHLQGDKRCCYGKFQRSGTNRLQLVTILGNQFLSRKLRLATVLVQLLIHSSPAHI